MFLLFSPFSFIFSFMYLAILLSLASVSDFLYFWLLIEFLMLLFIGVSYTVFTNNVSSLMVYFFTQSLSSFMVLVSFFLGSSELFSLSLFLNLGIFPFITWYVSSLCFFPTSVFYLASTLQKLPPLFLLLNTDISLSMSFFWISAILSAVFSGVLMLSSNSIRFLLVASSVSNNSWLLMAAQASFQSLSVFVIIYFSLLFSVLSFFSQFSEVVNPSPHPASLYSLSILCSLSGVPPSPLFLSNVAVILGLFDHSPLVSPLIAFLAFSVASSSAYVCFSIKFFISSFRF